MMEQVKTQVDQALGRLESAVEAIGQRAAEREAELSRRLETARQEAAAAREEAATLKQLLDETSLRLDQAIERLQGLLAKAISD